MSSDGFSMTRLPAASMPPKGLNASVTGKFHGDMLPTTPSGTCRTADFAPIQLYGKLERRRVGRIHAASCERAYLSALSGGKMSNNRVFNAERRPKSAATAAHSAS